MATPATSGQASAHQPGALDQADRRDHQAEDELRTALDMLMESTGQLRGMPGQEAREGFSLRVEKVLRTAEAEASEVLSTAAREAVILVEKARADAETHRRSVEQALIARAAELDQESARRQVEMQERAEQIADQLASARNEATQIVAAAQRDAIEFRKDAEATVGELRQHAADGVRRQQQAAEHEWRRLIEMQNGVQGGLAHLHTLLRTLGIGNSTPEEDEAAAVPGPFVRLGRLCR